MNKIIFIVLSIITSKVELNNVQSESDKNFIKESSEIMEKIDGLKKEMDKELDNLKSNSGGKRLLSKKRNLYSSSNYSNNSKIAEELIGIYEDDTTNIHNQLMNLVNQLRINFNQNTQFDKSNMKNFINSFFMNYYQQSTVNISNLFINRMKKLNQLLIN